MKNYRKLKMVNCSTQIPAVKLLGSEAYFFDRLDLNVMGNSDHGAGAQRVIKTNNTEHN